MNEKLLKEMNGNLQTVENLLILQLIQNGTTADQIEIVLKTKSISPTNLAMLFPIKKLQSKNAKEK